MGWIKEIKYLWLISSILLIVGSAIGKETLVGDMVNIIAWGFLLVGLWKNEQLRRLQKESKK